MKNPKDLINWVALSKHLCGKPTYISRTRVPKKYMDKVDGLLQAIESWSELNAVVDAKQNEKKRAQAAWVKYGAFLSVFGIRLKDEFK